MPRNRVVGFCSEAGREGSDSPRAVATASTSRSTRNPARPASGDRPAGSSRSGGDGNGFLASRDHAHGLDGGSARDRGGSPTIRILVADDHPIYRDGLTSLINRQPGMIVVAEASNGREAVDAFARQAPDLALIDLRMPGLDGVEAIATIREKDVTARLVILTSFAVDEDIYRALRAGARGYLLKDVTREDLIDCIRTVHAGRTYIPPEIAAKLAERVTTIELTARERQVLGLVAKGLGNRDIGHELTVTEGTVKVHVNNILAKLGVASRTEAVTLAFRRGLVRLED
jgi:DNA-binding NarL/FixJ family response regulator